MAEGNKANDPQVDRAKAANLKIPPFWHKNVKLWFVQVESQFYNANVINDNAKYHHVMACIESSVLEQISDLVVNPPTEDKYKALKERLITEYTDSEERQTKILLNELELGDRKPSALLREMRNLSNGKVDDVILKTMFLEHMPTHARSILAVSSDTLSNMAVMADKILEITPIATVASAESSRDPTLDAIGKLQKQIDALTFKMKRPQQRGRFKPRNRSTSGHRSRLPPRELCWYHHNYKERATKCVRPCNYAGNVQAGN